MTDCTDVVYGENKTSLPCQIRLGVVYDKNHIGQRCDQSIGLVYNETKAEQLGLIWPRCTVWWKLDMTTMWLIVQVRSTLKTILNYCDWLDKLLFVMKTRHDNDMIDRTGAVYTENDIELSWLIGLGVNCYGNLIGKQCVWSYKISLCQKWNWVVMIDQRGSSLWWKLGRITTWLILYI